MSAIQPRPTPNDKVDIQTRVMVDLIDRRAFGKAKYGTPLQPFNGRDALRDAYEEALDLVCYLKQAITERDGETEVPVSVTVYDPESEPGNVYQTILENNLPDYARAAGYREGREAALKEKANNEDLRLAEEIDKSRQQIVNMLHSLLIEVPRVLTEVGYPLPQTYDVRDVAQLPRDLRLRLGEVSRDKQSLDLLRRERAGEVWLWQNDEFDAPGSLACPILISPEHLLPMWTRWIEPAVPREPVPAIIHCPRCGTQHVDKPEPEINWTNPDHKSHKCKLCKAIFRTADVPTVGVEAVKTRGEADTWPPL